MSNDKMREEFEAWASTHFFLQEEDTIVDDSDEYISGDMQQSWESWYASRAALVVELPRHLSGSVDFMNGGSEMRRLCWDAIEYAGVRVKP